MRKQVKQDLQIAKEKKRPVKLAMCPAKLLAKEKDKRKIFLGKPNQPGTLLSKETSQICSFQEEVRNRLDVSQRQTI